MLTKLAPARKPHCSQLATSSEVKATLTPVDQTTDQSVGQRLGGRLRRIIDACGGIQKIFGSAQFRRAHYQSLQTKTVAQLARRPQAMNPALVH